MTNTKVAMTFDLDDLLFETKYTITSGSAICYDEENNQLVFDSVNSNPRKIFCQYCHGRTFDDSRGNCIACGGERK